MATRKPLVILSGRIQEQPEGDLPAGAEPTVATPAAAPTEKYWRGDKTWRDFFTDVRAATLTGLSTATNAVVTATDTVLAAIGKLQAQVSAKANAASVREKLTAARTYYVRTDGSDSNDGLSNSSGGAFATIQKAWDVLATLDGGGFAATIAVADGTYTTPFNPKKIPVGFAEVVVVGNTVTPSLCHLSTSGSCVVVEPGVSLTMRGLKFSSAGDSLVRANFGAFCALSDIELGAATANNQITSIGGNISVSGAVRITGSSPACVVCQNGGYVGFNSAFTLVGTPAYGTFAIVRDASQIVLFGTSFTGSATGVRYSAQLNGIINTYGSGESFLPGNAAGTKTAGGQYA